MTDQRARDTIRSVRVSIGDQVVECPVSGQDGRLAVVTLPSGKWVKTTWDTIERVNANGKHLIV